MSVSIEQRRKNQAIKMIEIKCRTSIEKYIQAESLLEDRPLTKLILTDKDLQDLHHSLPTQIKRFIGELFNTDIRCLLSAAPKSEPPVSFLEDINNFFPNFELNLQRIIQMEVSQSSKLENVFQSEYTFPGRIIKNLYKRHNFQLFSQMLLERGLTRMCKVRNELVIDFAMEYERIKELTETCSSLNYFIFGQTTQRSELTKDLEFIFGQFQDPESLEAIIDAVLISQENTQNRSILMSDFKALLEIDEKHVNFKLGMLALKSINQSKKAIEEIVSLFIDDILNSLSAFPHEMRALVCSYQKLCRQKFPEQNSEDTKNFLIKTVFSKWIFTDLMRWYSTRQSVLDIQRKNTNFSMVCLVLQKILYGQEFYDKEKHSCFNKLILGYHDRVTVFLENFKSIDNQQINTKKQQQKDIFGINVTLLSFESIIYLIECFKGNPQDSSKIQSLSPLQKTLNKSLFHIGNQKYSPSQLYVLQVDYKIPNLSKIFLPLEKNKRIIIQFLLAINEVKQPIPVFTLLEMNRFGKEQGKMSKVPVQLYANYLLSILRPEHKLDKIVYTIHKQLDEMKTTQKAVRVLLEATSNYYGNLEKVYVSICQAKLNLKAQRTVEQLWTSIRIKVRLIHKAGDFLKYETSKQSTQHYLSQHAYLNINTVAEHKRSDKSITIYEAESIREFLKVLSYITQQENKLPTSNNQINSVYNSYLEDLVDYLTSQQKVEAVVLQRLQQRMGTFLFNSQILTFGQLDYTGLNFRLRVRLTQTTSDQELYQKMCLLSPTVSIKQLQPKYVEQEQLFLQSTRSLVETLNEPDSAQGILRKFCDISLTFQHIILCTGKASDITADVQIPLMIYIMIKGKIPNLPSLLRFLDNFILDETRGSVLGQTLTLIHSCVVLINQMQPAGN